MVRLFEFSAFRSRLKPVQWLNQQKASLLMLELLQEYYPNQKVVLDNLLEAKPDEGSSKSSFRSWCKEVKQVAIDTRYLVERAVFLFTFIFSTPPIFTIVTDKYCSFTMFSNDVLCLCFYAVYSGLAFFYCVKDFAFVTH